MEDQWQQGSGTSAVDATVSSLIYVEFVQPNQSQWILLIAAAAHGGWKPHPELQQAYNVREFWSSDAQIDKQDEHDKLDPI